MKLRNVVLASVAGMLLTSTTVYSLTPAPRAAAATPPGVGVETAPPSSDPAGPPSSFEQNGTIHVEGRLGHTRLARGARGQTFLMIEARSGEGLRAARPAASHLAVVIDRSGSMRGSRIANARLGAKTAVDRLGDGDVISVVAFDTRATVVVPATSIDDVSRARVKTAIDGIVLGGDTCISCGIEEGMRELAGSSDKVDRMILLSDGEATDGVRDVSGLRQMAQRARGMNATVSTIGVGLGYNQLVLGSIAQEAGGGHHFIEDAASLDRAFQTEADELRSTIATGAEAVIDLGDGVDVARVFDRGFERRGRKIVVPLGAFARDEAKTVLVELSLPTNAEGALPVASVEVGYRDLVNGGQGRASGALGLAIGGEKTAELDPLVAGRVARSGTGAVLLRANELAARGAVDEAQRMLADQEKVIAAVAAAPRPTVPARKAKAFDKDLEGQAGSLEDARRGLQKTSKPDDIGRSVRANQAAANPFFK